MTQQAKQRVKFKLQNLSHLPTSSYLLSGRCLSRSGYFPGLDILICLDTRLNQLFNRSRQQFDYIRHLSGSTILTSILTVLGVCFGQKIGLNQTFDKTEHLTQAKFNFN